MTVDRALSPEEIDMICPGLAEDIRALNAGEIDFREFYRRENVKTQQQLFPRLIELKNARKWEEFIDLALIRWEVMGLAFQFYDEVPDELKYNFAVEAYTHHGDSMPVVRKAVRGARKYGAPVLPEELREQAIITIYRAGEEPIDKARYRISWTTDLEKAVWFYSEYIGRHAKHIYRGEIKTADIIAYTDDRGEHEVMQYRKVFDVEDITEEVVGLCTR